MPMQKFRNDVRSAHLKQAGFAAVSGAIFLGVVVYGLRPQGLPLPQADMAITTKPDESSAVRQDTTIPHCDSLEALAAVQGELTRTQTVRISGLANIEQTASDDRGNRSCSAVMQLAFGSKPITYVIRRLAPGRKTWELQITGT